MEKWEPDKKNVLGKVSQKISDIIWSINYRKRVKKLRAELTLKKRLEESILKEKIYFD